jgi:hypothetical protein
MKDLPRLELTADPNKNNEFIIYRNDINDTKGQMVTRKKYSTKKYSTKKYSTKKYSTKKYSTKKYSTRKKKSRKSRKGFFNLF